MSLVVCVGELEPQNVVLIKPVALERVYDQRGLQDVLEVSEAEVDLLTTGLVSEDEAEGLEAGEGPEDV